MEDVFKDFGLVLGAILIAFGKEVLSWLKKKKSSRITFSDGLDYDVLINEELDYLKYKFGFSRCSVVKFHNGMESFDGMSFNFASMTHERVQSADALIREYQKIPIAPLAKIYSDLDKEPKGYLSVDADNSDAGVIQDAWDAKRNYIVRLGTRIGNGILTCVYSHEIKDLTEEQISEIRASAYKIKLFIDKKKKP